MTFRFVSLRVVAAMLALAPLASCSDDDEPAATPAPTVGMNWKVNGTSEAAGTNLVSAVTSPLAPTEIVVMGYTNATATGNNIRLQMPKATGTYTITATSATSADYYVGTTDYEATVGTIVVKTSTPSTTAGASIIEGTFTFTGTNSAVTPATTRAITEGTFYAKY